jgi:hypothetical protein
VFDGNKTATTSGSHKYEGGSAINIVHGAVYADQCIFKNNYDNTRNGCVKMSGANDYPNNPAYLFLNACSFTDNTVKNANTSAGAVIRQNRKGGLLGMYNCTLYNNVVNGTGKHAIQIDKAAIIVNTTIIDDFGGTGNYPIRYRNDTQNGHNHFILANNLIMHTEGDTPRHSISVAGTSGSDFMLYFKGGNLIGTRATSGAKYINITEDNEYVGYHYSDINNPSFTNNVYKWDGTLTADKIVCNKMSKESVEAVLKSTDINQVESYFSITGNNGDETYAGFYTWLNSIGAIDKDATGASRPATGWTPGAYQVPVQAN